MTKIIREAVETEFGAESKSVEEVTDRGRQWREWADDHSSDSPKLSDEAVSRESIYGERG